MRTDTLSIAPKAAGLNVRYRTVVRMRDAWLDGWDSDRLLPEAVEINILPAPQRADDVAEDGLPDVLRLPLMVALRPAPPQPEGDRAEP